MKIYIAGPMTGHDNYNRYAFDKEAFRMIGEGHCVLNPAMLPNGLTEPEYMDICLAMLRCANVIYLLRGWRESAGARAEHAIAEKLGLIITYQEDNI